MLAMHVHEAHQQKQGSGCQEAEVESDDKKQRRG